MLKLFFKKSLDKSTENQNEDETVSGEQKSTENMDIEDLADENTEKNATEG